jgi:hypothetical protein
LRGLPSSTRIIGSYAPITSPQRTQCGFSGVGFGLSEGLRGWDIALGRRLFSLIDADAERRFCVARSIRGIPQSGGGRLRVSSAGAMTRDSEEPWLRQLLILDFDVKAGGLDALAAGEVEYG